MPEPPVHVCISPARSCSTSPGQGDSIGLPGERIFPLSISSKCLYSQRTGGRDGAQIRLRTDVWVREAALKLISKYLGN